MPHILRLCFCWIAVGLCATAGGQTWDAGVDLESFRPERTVRVSTLGELEEAIASARAGDLIEVGPGEYVTRDFIAIQRLHGRPDAPIVLRAVPRGEATITGGAGFRLEHSSHLAIEGFNMVHSTTHHAFLLDGCNHVRITRNRVRLVQTDEQRESRAVYDWVEIIGDFSHMNRIDHNLIEGKRTRGVMVQIGGAGVHLRNESSKFDRVDHNHFRDFECGLGNGYETLRLGESTFSHSSAHTLVDHNLFERCSGEGEIISVKSNDNIIRNNTIVDSFGQITLRNCHRVLVEGNFMLNPSGVERAEGVRAYGTGHRIVNNYFQDLTGPAIILNAGDIERRWRSQWMFQEAYAEEFNWDLWGGYQVPVEVQVSHNTVVDCHTAIVIGGGWAAQPRNLSAYPNVYPNPPRDCHISNNIFHVTRPVMIELLTPPKNWTWRGNIFHSTREAAQLGLEYLSEDEARMVDPRFEAVDGVRRLSSSSPAIDGAQPLDRPWVVSQDMHGRPRGERATVGAEEYTVGEHAWRRPLTHGEVGPDA